MNFLLEWEWSNALLSYCHSSWGHLLYICWGRERMSCLSGGLCVSRIACHFGWLTMMDDFGAFLVVVTKFLRKTLLQNLKGDIAESWEMGQIFERTPKWQRWKDAIHSACAARVDKWNYKFNYVTVDGGVRFSECFLQIYRLFLFGGSFESWRFNSRSYLFKRLLYFMMK